VVRLAPRISPRSALVPAYPARLVCPRVFPACPRLSAALPNLAVLDQAVICAIATSTMKMTDKPIARALNTIPVVVAVWLVALPLLIRAWLAVPWLKPAPPIRRARMQSGQSTTKLMRSRTVPMIPQHQRACPRACGRLRGRARLALRFSRGNFFKVHAE
jgi:hypothetical protein